LYYEAKYRYIAAEQSKTVESGRGQRSEFFIYFFYSGVPRPQFPTRFQEKFGSGRTRGAIIERTQRLGLLKKENCSEAGLQNVRDYGNLDLQDFCAQFRQKFGLDRTFKALKRQRLLQRSTQPDD
jgi:hypothetical protein